MARSFDVITVADPDIGQRPDGVIVLSVLTLVTAVISVLILIDLLGTHLVELSFALLFLIVIQCGIAWGLWALRPWGWAWGVVLFGTGAVVTVSNQLWPAAFVCIGAVVYLIYLKPFYHHG